MKLNYVILACFIALHSSVSTAVLASENANRSNIIAIGNNSEVVSQSEATARKKMEKLKSLITQAEQKGLDAQREEGVLWMANEFLRYAAWDEQNIEQNYYQFLLWAPYKDNAQQRAEQLPEFERSEINKMLDDAIKQITDVIDGKIVRRATASIDWSSIKVEGDQFVSNNRSVFINHFNRLPDELFNPYCGMVDRVGLGLDMLKNSDGDLTDEAIATLESKKESYSGNVFLGHGTPPKWMKEVDSTVEDGMRRFIKYDIDNPFLRDMWVKLAAKVVPQYVGKKYSDHGYILANEPHWVTIRDTWAVGDFSQYTIEKFKCWLVDKHKTISRLNELWNSDFASFDDITVEVPFDAELRGTPKGYDIMMFNQDRCTEWFQFLADEIKKNDPDAKVHVKAVPRLFRQDIRDHGIDLERVTELSDIVGNDGKVTGRLVSSKSAESWEKDFCYNWMDIGVSFDFMSSVAPNKPNINSESHYLSATNFRDLYLSKEFTRSSYWLSTIQGQSLSYTWVWARDLDGSISSNFKAGKTLADNVKAASYIGSVVQQPRVTNEVSQTYMDLNAFSEEIAQIQRLRRPMRLFYSESSAINVEDYMERLIEFYTPLFFEGNPVGFATERIITKQDNNLWDVIAVRNNCFVKESEIKALQTYLDNGGTVLLDNVSLKMNEYGEPHTLKLKESKGEIIHLSSLNQFIAKSLEVVKSKGSTPEIVVKETNDRDAKGCVWRVIQTADDKYMVNIINIGAGDALIDISSKNGSITTITDQFTGAKIDSSFSMKPHDIMLLEIKK
ncbi:MAG: beta-galactosidase [Rikenellaceae bacterium]